MLNKLGVLALCMAATSFAGEAPRTATRAELRDFLKALPAAYQKETWYGTVADGAPTDSGACGIDVLGSDGKKKASGLSLFVGDVNNDGQADYTLVSRCGGSLAVDTVLEAFDRSGAGYSPLGFSRVLERNHLDGSKLPLGIAEPFLAVESGVVVMHFKSPAQTWIWKGSKMFRK